MLDKATMRQEEKQIDKRNGVFDTLRLIVHGAKSR